MLLMVQKSGEHQLQVGTVVYPIFYVGFLYIPGGAGRISEPYWQYDNLQQYLFAFKPFNGITKHQRNIWWSFADEHEHPNGKKTTKVGPGKLSWTVILMGNRRSPPPG